MSFKICKECGSEIPNEATTCRYCGRKGIPVIKRGYWRPLIGVAVLIGAWGIVANNPKPTMSASDVAYTTYMPDGSRVSHNKPKSPQETDYLYTFGDLLKAEGAITAYDISVWWHTFDISISSLLPGEAREVAAIICNESRSTKNVANWPHGWELRVFILADSDHPAAVCKL